MSLMAWISNIFNSMIETLQLDQDCSKHFLIRTLDVLIRLSKLLAVLLRTSTPTLQIKHILVVERDLHMPDAMTRLKVEKSCLTRALRLISKAVHQEAPGILSAVVETWWLLSPMLLILLQEFFRHSLSLLQLPFRVKSSNHLQASPLRHA
jgi:hypothetical protein